jgi:hypothetical protein
MKAAGRPRLFGEEGSIVVRRFCLVCLYAVLFMACGDRQAGQSPSEDQVIAESPAPPAAQHADRDLLGEIELARTEDPSFESVASHLPALKRPREVVGVKYHPHDIGVAPDATLELSDDVSVVTNPVAYFEVGEPAVRFGAEPAGCRKSLVEGAPVVTAVFEHDGVVYRQTVFGHAEGLSPDAPLSAFVELRAESEDPARRRTKASLRIGPGNAAGIVRTWDLDLAARVPTILLLKIPFDMPEKGWAEVEEPAFKKRRSEVLDFWKADLRAGTELRAPEKRVNEARGAWLAYASLDVDKNGDVLEPHDGAGFYEQVYGYSAALYPHALDLWGRHEEARRILESLLTFQAPDGVFTSHFGTPDTGALLFALCEHFALTADAAWLRRVAPNMVRMAGWIAAKRRESMTPADAPRTATYGLIKFRPYCDSLDPAYDYFGDTYCAAGLEKTARALAAVGLEEESGRVAREAEAYRRDILDSMDKAVFASGGLKVLPLEPETRRILNDSKGRASDYYSLIASCMLESEFLPAADERAGWVMRFMEEKGGLRLGMCEFAGGIDHAYTYGYWLDCLKLDRVKPAILGFYGSLAYGMSRETYAGVEVTKLFTGDNDPTLPHLYSCTQQLRLLRMMLVQEDGERLWIGRALPGHWLAGEAVTELRAAPTAFGPVSFVIHPHPSQDRTDVELWPPARRTPEAILLRLRDPERRKIVDVKVNGRTIRTFDGDTIELRAPEEHLDIEVTYAQRRSS